MLYEATNPNIWGFAPAGGTLVPDFINSRDDIRNLFNGIDYSNSGTGFGPDSFSRKRFDFILADLADDFLADRSFFFLNYKNNMKIGFKSIQQNIFGRS